MNPDVIPLVSAVAGAGVGACLALVFMLLKLDAEKTRANGETMRADGEKTRADGLEQRLADAERRVAEADGRSETARAVETELRVQVAVTQSANVGLTHRAERAEADLVIVRVQLANEEAVSHAEGKRADDNARALDEARHRIEVLIPEISVTQSVLENTRESLKDAECLLSGLRPLYAIAEKAARYHAGEHAYHKSKSESRLVRIKLLEAHVIYLHEKLMAAESRAVQKEVTKSIVELAKIILSGHGLPPVPGKA